MFERFAEEARSAVTEAAALAGEAGDPAVDPGHLLVAVAHAAGTPASLALARLGLDREAIEAAIAGDRDGVLAAVGVAADVPPRRRLAAQPKFAPATKRALERALQAATARGDRRIGTEHLLLGLIADEHGRVRRVLAASEVDAEELRAALS